MHNNSKETGNALIAECAVNARICGIGLSMTDLDRMDRKNRKGTGMLEYALMKVRDKLK